MLAIIAWNQEPPSVGSLRVPEFVIAASSDIFRLPALRRMTRLTYQWATAHDHWSEEPAYQRAIPRLMLWWRHFARHHADLVDGLEWVACGLLAITLLTAELIAQA
jgi:hypothetical protein